MNIKKLKDLIQQGESSTLEFKKSTGQLSSATETVCAFLNGNGGIVLIGVTNNGDILGQDVTDNTKKEIARELHKIEPSAQIEVQYIPIEKNKRVIAITATLNDHVPYVYDGRPFQRNQSTTSKMSQHRYEQFLVKRGQLNYSWEDYLTDYTIDSLDQEEIHRTITDGIRENRIPASAAGDIPIEILNRLKLLADGKLKQAAIVLYAKEELADFPQCMIRMARFRGLDKLEDFIDNQLKYGNAFYLLKEADAFLQRHLPIASFFKANQFKRIDKPILPVLAVREALINALCHRDYSNRSASIALAIYDDRLEIWNNGTLPDKITLADLKRPHDSLPRNKLIAKVFHARGLIERWGTGTNKMIDLCKKEGDPEPEFSEYTGGLSVIFKFKEPIGTTRQPITPLPPLTNRQKTILAIIESSDELVQIQKIMKELENPPSQRMVQIDLNYLKTQGLIEQIGKGRNTLWAKKPR